MKTKLKKPRNQYHLALRYLIEKDEFSLLDVIKDSMFFKFQTRLSELEKEHGYLVKKRKVSFTNRFGNSSDYFIYSAIDKEQLIKIYNKI